MTSDANRRNVPSLLNVSLLGEVSEPIKAPTFEVNSTLPALQKAISNYMAIMESMGPIFLGTIFKRRILPFFKDFPYPMLDGFIIIQPAHLMQSMLPFTTELLPMSSRIFYKETPFVVSQWVVVDEFQYEDHNFTVVVLGFATEASTFNRSLGPTIEQLFHNLSMSFLSEPAFVKDSDEEVLITVWQSRNIYSYRHTNVLLSYVLALGLSLLACIVGWTSVVNNNASYSNRFSTTLRVLSGRSVTSLVAPEDCKDKDPLPRYLAKARIDLSQGRRVQEGNGESEVELQQILEQPSETASRRSLGQGLQEDDAEPQQQRELAGFGGLRRRTSSEVSQNPSEAQVHHWPEAILERNASVESSAIGNEGLSHTVSRSPSQHVHEP